MKRKYTALFLLMISTLNPIWVLSDDSSQPGSTPTDTNPDKNDGSHRSKAPSKRNVELSIQGNILFVRFLSDEGNATLKISNGYTGSMESYSFNTSILFSCILSNPISGSNITIETEKGNTYKFEM